MTVAYTHTKVLDANGKERIIEPMSLDLTLPWIRQEKQEQRFKRLVIAFLALMLLLILVLMFSPVVDRKKDEDEEIVAKTKVLLKPVVLKPVEEPPKPKPEPKPEIPKPDPVSKTKSLAKSEKPAEKPTEEPTSHGLNQVSSQLSALRNSFDLTRNKKKNLSDSTAGKKEQTSRTLLGKDNATKKSKGIKIDDSVMIDERTTLAAHNAAAVQGVDTGGVDGGSPVSRYASHISGERTMESIRYTLEKNKGGIFALYYQALNDNPKLSGKYAFEMRIEPNGEISSLKLVSSELGDDRLNKAILNRIQRIKFKAEDVIAARVTYTYTFIEN